MFVGKEHPYDHPLASQKFVEDAMMEGKRVQSPKKVKKVAKPKEYLEISIHGGTVDEWLQVSCYESSEDSDVIKDFKERKDLHEDFHEEEVYEFMVERYRPRNYASMHREKSTLKNAMMQNGNTGDMINF